MSEFWKMVELKDGEPVVFLAVHALRWQPEWGEPKVGFIQIDEEEDELRAELARREARIAELEQERRWIPVGEKLPEVGELILCAYKSKDKYYFAQSRMNKECKFKITQRSKPVTHWMPLPPPPEAD